MQVSVGIDIAKDLHWVTAMDERAEILLDRKLPNVPEEIDRLIEDLHELGGERTIGIDVVGGIAALVSAMLLEAGESIVHVPGLAVNRARQGTTGGENKSDPRDARVIADQVRTRQDLRPLKPQDEPSVELRLLVGRRRDLVAEQTRRLGRLHDLLVGIHPGLERRLDLTTKGGLFLLTRYVTPAEIRAAGKSRIARFLKTAGGLAHTERLAETALQAAREQTFRLPGETTAARFCRELAADALQARRRLAQLDRQLQEAVHAHPDGALILTLPGMGVTLTAEFLVEAGPLERFRSPDALASAAGIAPVIRQSGKTRFIRRPSGGNKGLKRVFYQSAFCSLPQPESRAFYDRKRREGKRHHQALLSLARRRVNVLWAMLRDQTPYEPRQPKAMVA